MLFCFCSSFCVFQIGHVTKSGEIAGPRVLEHIVDVVLYMEVGTLLPSLFWIVSHVIVCFFLLLFLPFLLSA
jgi:hypothetical protein